MKSFTEFLKEIECWKGYKKVGTKIKNGKKVNDCVKIDDKDSDRRKQPS